jgi:DNA-directed RNA polymerase sigma subunit (sigma70/sigma32)
MKTSRLTTRAIVRMARVLSWRREGKTLEWIGRKLKVTRERVRQIQKLAEYRRS